MSYPQGFNPNRLIDVNQNVGLLSSPYRPSGNQHAFELEEQIKAYRRELAKKDDLIAQLSARSPRLDNKDFIDPLRTSLNTTGTDYQFRTNGYNFDSSAAELAASKMKIENLTAEIRELQSKLGVKDSYIVELKSKLQLMNENSARQTALITTLREHIQQAEHQSGTLEEITSKGTVTIQTLQRENREAQEKIIDLEARLRNYALNKEETEQEAESFRRKYYDALTQFGDALNTDTEGGHMENAVEVLVEKAKIAAQEQLLLETKLQTMQDAMDSNDLATKASRETITRLVSEVGKEQRSMSEMSNTVERLKRERDDVTLEKESLQREVELMKERVMANEKTWVSSREELTQTVTKANLLSEDLKRMEHEKNLISTEFKMFQESMAKILSGPYVDVVPREDSIKDRIRELAASEREKKAQIDMLDAKVGELSNQLERQCELHHDSIRRARKAETFALQHENRVQDLESELATGDVIRETLRHDKAKYIDFMQQMARAMRMDEIAADLGYDFNTDVLVARAHQLAKLEADELLEKASSNHTLHKKVKTLQEQLKSKHLHMDLLRKKIAQLEEKDNTRSALAIDRDDAIVTVQRLHRKIERLQHALGDEKVKVTQLKAQLAETNQLKAVTLEQRRKIDELVDNVGKLSNTKERQKLKLSNLKRNLNTTEASADENNARLRSQLDAVTDDLKSTKTLLDEVQRREKQLVDFREVVARMLGLDVTSLAIPDYEVISRLEKLIRTHHIETAATTALDRSLEAMSTRFRAGYQDPLVRSSSPNRYHSPTPPRYSRGRERSPRRHHRSRSPSPQRY